MSNLTRRAFIKATSLAAVGFFVAGCGGNDKSAATSGGSDKPADLVVYGKIFTSEDNKIVEAFAVKDGKFVYVGDKAGVKACSRVISSSVHHGFAFSG